MASKDPEKKRVAQRRYQASEKGKATTERYRRTSKGVVSRTRQSINQIAKRRGSA